MHRTSVLLLSSADQEPQGPGAPGAQWAPTAFGGGRRFAPLHGKSGNTEKAEKTENGKSGKTKKTARIDWKSIIEDGPKMARPEIHHRGWALWIDRKSIIEDASEMDHNSQIGPREPWRDPVQNTRFLHLLARNRSILEDGPDLAWFWGDLGTVWGYFRTDCGPTLKNLKIRRTWSEC